MPVGITLSLALALVSRRLLVLAVVVAVAAGVAAERSTNDPPRRAATGVAAGEASNRDRLYRAPARTGEPPIAEAPVAEPAEPADQVVQSPPEPEPPPPSAAPEIDLAVAPVAADDPAGLAEQILVAERAIRDDRATPTTIARFGHLQQVAYRALVVHPEWDAQVAAALPPDLRPVMAANVAAGRELRRPLRKPQTQLPAWRIVEPAPAAELRAYYEEGEARYGVPWEYLAAINLTETRMGRIRGLSTAGARGPMQFIPSTWASYGQGDIDDPHDAILAAARYLAANGGGSGNLANALYRYNPVSWYVKAVTLYAEQMEADDRAYLGYHAWQVYFTTALGDVLLPVGYEATERRPVTPADLT